MAAGYDHLTLDGTAADVPPAGDPSADQGDRGPIGTTPLHELSRKLRCNLFHGKGREWRAIFR